MPSTVGRVRHRTSQTIPHALLLRPKRRSAEMIQHLERIGPTAEKAAAGPAETQTPWSSRNTPHRPSPRQYCALGARAGWCLLRRPGHIHQRPKNGATRWQHKVLQASEASSSRRPNLQRVRTARGWPTRGFSHRQAERIALAMTPCSGAKGGYRYRRKE